MRKMGRRWEDFISAVYSKILPLIAFSKDIKDLLNERLPKKGGNPKEGGKEERIETSGAGALGGMVVGGALGLPFGPFGIVIGGILGALLGNQVEYESKRAERKKNKVH
ncbi:MAG: hypothetical protein ACXQTW_08175 [Candidatus Methanospirareceae archaeon]